MNWKDGKKTVRLALDTLAQSLAGGDKTVILDADSALARSLAGND